MRTIVPVVLCGHKKILFVVNFWIYLRASQKYLYKIIQFHLEALKNTNLKCSNIFRLMHFIEVGLIRPLALMPTYAKKV